MSDAILGTNSGTKKWPLEKCPHESQWLWIATKDDDDDDNDDDGDDDDDDEFRGSSHRPPYMFF